MIKSRSPLNVLILGRLRQFSGNSSTANRIRQYFEENGFYCVVKDVEQYRDRVEFINYLHNDQIQVIFGIHAYIAGSVLKDCPLPYSLIFGGTDLNEDNKDVEKLEVMTEAVTNAQRLIGFSKPMVNKAEKLWPTVEKEKFITIPQDWHQLGNRKVFLVIVGPKLDREYGNNFDELIDGCPGIIYLGAQTTYTTHAIIKESFALINCSISEGMALSILEAMDLEVPVIARNIPGNAALIEHGVTGLLYSGPDDFIVKAEQLIKDKELRQSIIKNAKEKLGEEHNCKRERSIYVEIATSLKAQFNLNWFEDLSKVDEEPGENEQYNENGDMVLAGKENLLDKICEQNDSSATSKSAGTKSDGGPKCTVKAVKTKKPSDQAQKDNKKCSKPQKVSPEVQSDLKTSKKKISQPISAELSKGGNTQTNKQTNVPFSKVPNPTSQKKK